MPLGLKEVTTMSASSTPTSITTAGSFLPPGLLNLILDGFANDLRSPIGYVLVVTILASWLVPLLVALFYFSTPTSRKQVIFILNIISIVTGIGIAIWTNYMELRGILHPTEATDLISLNAFTFMSQIVPWFAEFILAYRLLAIFPLRSTSRSTLLAIFIFPFTVKAIRLAAVIIFFEEFSQKTKGTHGSPLEIAVQVGFRNSPWTKVDWFLQIFDNSYLSAIFIWKLYARHIFEGSSYKRATLGLAGSLSSKLKILFWIAVENFVFPVIFNIVLLIDVFVDPNYFQNDSILLFVNYYISLIGVVFATVWSSSYAYKTSHINPTESALDALQIPSPPIQSTGSTFTDLESSERTAGRPDQIQQGNAQSSYAISERQVTTSTSQVEV